MFVTYHRGGTVSVLPTLAAAAAALIIVGGIAVTTLAVVGVIVGSTQLLRAFGFVSAARRLQFQDDAIDGIVVDRSSAGLLDR